MSDLRRLLYRFLSLPYLVQLAVARSAGLLSGEECGIDDDVERNRLVVRRAVERGALRALWDAVSSATEVEAHPTNPFRGATP